MMDTLVQRCAGLDVHKDLVVACARTPDAGDGRASVSASFGTTTSELLALRDWLLAHNVTLVAMEATGVYWKPIFYVLEEAVECWLLNARHLRNVPGRKTDINDAAWIAQLVEHGLVRPSFVPPKEIRELRNLTHYRRAQVEERTRETQRLDKVLQDAGVKLSSVATDTLGKSARAMLDALVAGTRDPQVLADLAQGLLRKKLPALQDALAGRFSAHHGLLVGGDPGEAGLPQRSDRPSHRPDRRAPKAPRRPGRAADHHPRRRRRARPGADRGDRRRHGPLRQRRTTGVVGGDVPRPAPVRGKAKSGKTRKGSKWLRANLTQAAKAATRTKNTYLSAHHRRIKARRGHAIATIAVGHSILVAAFHWTSPGEPYQDLGPDHFDRRDDPERRARRLAGQIRALGFDVQLAPAT